MNGPITMRNMAEYFGDASLAHQVSAGTRLHEVSSTRDLSGNKAPAHPAGAAQGFTVTLPLPPSTNNLFKAVGRARAKSQGYRLWTEAAGWALKQERPVAISDRYALLLALPQAMRGDLDNRLKAVGDLLVTHKLTPDDRYADLVMAHRSNAVSGKACIVTVVPIQQVSAALASVGGGPRPLPAISSPPGEVEAA